jgi:DNA-binding NarL/FixJ family response regulator
MSNSREKRKIPGKKVDHKANGRGIFIVEDEIVIVRGLEDALARLDYPVCGFARTGEEALAAIAGHRPDLALVDICLPGAMDGIQLAGLLQEAHALPVIYLTAYAHGEILARALATSPFGYVVKPFRETQLKAAIELALARAREEEDRRGFLDQCQNTIGDLEEQLQRTRSELEAAAVRLAEKDQKLQQLRQEVQEVNRALLSLSGHIARTREELEMEVAIAVRTRVLPILRQLMSDPGFGQYRLEFDMLSMHMQHLTAGLGKTPATAGVLSATELRLAALIKNGLSNQQIADKLFLSLETVKTHRRNIRRKLGLQNSKENLATHLKARWDDPRLLSNG